MICSCCELFWDISVHSCASFIFLEGPRYCRYTIGFLTTKSNFYLKDRTCSRQLHPCMVMHILLHIHLSFIKVRLSFAGVRQGVNIPPFAYRPLIFNFVSI